MAKVSELHEGPGKYTAENSNCGTADPGERFDHQNTADAAMRTSDVLLPFWAGCGARRFGDSVGSGLWSIVALVAVTVDRCTVAALVVLHAPWHRMGGGRVAGLQREHLVHGWKALYVGNCRPGVASVPAISQHFGIGSCALVVGLT